MMCQAVLWVARMSNWQGRGGIEWKDFYQLVLEVLGLENRVWKLDVNQGRPSKWDSLPGLCHQHCSPQMPLPPCWVISQASGQLGMTFSIFRLLEVNCDGPTLNHRPIQGSYDNLVREVVVTGSRSGRWQAKWRGKSRFKRCSYSRIEWSTDQGNVRWRYGREVWRIHLFSGLSDLLTDDPLFLENLGRGIDSMLASFTILPDEESQSG